MAWYAVIEGANLFFKPKQTVVRKLNTRREHTSRRAARQLAEALRSAHFTPTRIYYFESDNFKELK